MNIYSTISDNSSTEPQLKNAVQDFETFLTDSKISPKIFGLADAATFGAKLGAVPLSYTATTAVTNGIFDNKKDVWNLLEPKGYFHHGKYDELTNFV